MRIMRIDQTLEKCEEHLSLSSVQGTEIERLLTQSILVIMCAEFEREIRALVQGKCSSVEDGSIREFLGYCIDTAFRRIKSSEIASSLARFGPSYKEAFRQKEVDNPRAVTFYNNIVTNRNAVAHSEGSSVTLREVKQFYEEGHVVLDYLHDALLQGSSTL